MNHKMNLQLELLDLWIDNGYIYCLISIPNLNNEMEFILIETKNVK